MDWNYSQSVKIIFGNNKIQSIEKIFNELGLKNGILISDPIFVKNGLAQKVLEYSNGLLKEIFYDITPNPTVTNVDDCASIIRNNNYEFAVALGGGSSLDCAKAACSVCKTEDSIVLYHSGLKKFKDECIPLIAIPTTSGTGSEVTQVSVLSDTERGIKAPIASLNFYPYYAIVDPTLTITVPPQVTASTGMDVLSHALEGFYSINHQPICDALALHAAGLVFDYLLKAYNNGEDLEAREKMCEASLMAGLAFSIPKTAASHACSYPLTSKYHMPHGEACAFTMDAFVKINAEAENGRLNNFAKKLGFVNAFDMADRILDMKKKMRMKTTLKDAGIEYDEIEELSKLSQHPNMNNNPVKMELDDIIKMYKSIG